MNDVRGANYSGDNPSSTELPHLEEKPLGCYIVGDSVVFGSGYKDFPSETIANWVYDLNQYVAANGGWTPNGWDRDPFPYKKIRREFARG